MTRELAVLGALALLTGTFLTAHVIIVAGLFVRRPRWRAVIALLMPPLAPILAYNAGLHVRAIIWGLATLTYVLVRVSFRV